MMPASFTAPLAGALGACRRGARTTPHQAAAEPARRSPRVALRMLGPGPVTVFLFQVPPEYHPVVIMGSLLAVVPHILAFVLLQRFRRGGPNAGSVK